MNTRADHVHMETCSDPRSFLQLFTVFTSFTIPYQIFVEDILRCFQTDYLGLHIQFKVFFFFKAVTFWRNDPPGTGFHMTCLNEGVRKAF